MAQTSVVIPAHNERDLLPRALESVLRQSETAIEVIVVDDGSTDGTGELLEQLARRDSRVRPIRQPHSGIVAALNRGLAEARGDYIARMDADDVSRPDRLRRQADFLDQHPEIGLVSCGVEYLGDAGSNRGLALFVDWTNSLLTSEDIDLYRFVESPLIHPSVMFRKELPDQFGVYRDGDFPEDYELWLRWLAAGVRMAKLNDVLIEWHERPGRLTRTDPRYSVEAFYRTKAPYLERWLARHNPHHPNVIIWGAGRTSRQRQRYLTDLGIRVEAYVDIDPRKIGYRIGTAPVIGPEELPPAGSCFVLGWVGSRGAREDIEQRLQQRGFRRGFDYLPCA
ncbi:MAG: glycosyltransferase [bacterium]|nr:glycosyltransferase [bacterium]